VARISSTMTPRPVVHLELHTGNLARACAFYSRVCGWRVERVDAGAGPPYHLLGWGGALGGGVVECGTERPLWLPYVEVASLAAATEHARRLGATVLLPPRDGPAGRRSVVAVPDGAELALWQPRDVQTGRRAAS
jgi:predicted enzyme related to lactoylglutathione lyase